MSLWYSTELFNAIGGDMTRPMTATGVSIDSRTLQKGDLFFAIHGENGDGHDYIADALANGASGIVMHRQGPNAWTHWHQTIPDGTAAFFVTDTTLALRRLGKAGRDRMSGKLAAVTGSVGKTSTKEMLRLILAASGKTAAAAASYNNHLGVPLTLSRIPRDAKFAVAEIGMNNRGEIAILGRIAQPHVAIVTAIAPVHIGNLGSLAAIAEEKASLLKYIFTEKAMEEGEEDKPGIAILPADTEFRIAFHRASPFGRKIWFGESADADARLLDYAPDATGSTVRAIVAGREVSFRLGAPGKHMALNAIAALAAAVEMGADLDKGLAALADFTALPGRGARQSLLGGAATLIDESYNASSASVRAALSVLGTEKGRRIVVLGDMLELGDFGPSEHAGLADSVAASADVLFTCGPLMRHLYEAVPANLRGAHATDSAELASIVAAAVQPGDVVLIKGSNGSRMNRVVQALLASGEVSRT